MSETMVEPQPPPETRQAVAAGPASAFETIYRAITSFRTFDPARGTARGWLLGIDAERAGRVLLDGLAALSTVD
ncbi:hypothetical protein [Crossiella sp. CA198]|uniref:hypothetical protein n=1 Tax=Crossiella sp. CA198 TaxID=3455607 RepID=UPI003F8D192B